MVRGYNRYRFDGHHVVGGHDLRQRRGRHVRRVAAQVAVEGAHDYSQAGKRVAPLARRVGAHQRDVNRHEFGRAAGTHRLHERLRSLLPGRQRAESEHAGQPGDGFELGALGRNAHARVLAGDAFNPRAKDAEGTVESLKVCSRAQTQHRKGEIAPGPRRLFEQRLGSHRRVEPRGILRRRPDGLSAGRGALHETAIGAERVALRRHDRA